MDTFATIIVGIWVLLGLIAWGSRSGHGITIRLFVILGPLGFLVPPPRE